MGLCSGATAIDCCCLHTIDRTEMNGGELFVLPSQMPVGTLSDARSNDSNPTLIAQMMIRPPNEHLVPP